MLLATVGRLIWVPLAFLIAAAGASFILVTLGLERATQVVRGGSGDVLSIGALLELLRQAQLIGSGLTLIPAILVVVIGEVARIRATLYYTIGGGIALAAIPLIARIGQGQTGAGMVPPTLIWQIFATAGFVGGFIYWLLAGRRA